MKKKGLDERQKQLTQKAGLLGCYVMFFSGAIVILVQLVWLGELKQVLGETVMLLAGGAAFLAANIRQGIWDRNQRQPSLVQNLLFSVVCSGIFSIFYTLFILVKGIKEENTAMIAALFFLTVTVLSFLCLTLLQRAARKKREKQEERYSE